MDCAANPNDPVCMVYYGTPPSAGQVIKTYSVNQQNILAALQQGPMTYGQSTTPGSTVNTFQTPSTAVTTVTPPSPWYKTWWGIGLLALGAGVTYFKIIKPRMTRAA